MYQQKTTIGIVDDDKDFRETLGELLSSIGYRTELFSSASELVRTADTTQAACLLVDLHLPDMTGLELARRLSATGHTVPIVFMTGAHDVDLHDQVWKLGCAGLLQKPFFPSELLETLSRAATRDS